MLKPICDICKGDIKPGIDEIYDKKIPVRKGYDIILTARVLLPSYKDNDKQSATFNKGLREKGDICLNCFKEAIVQWLKWLNKTQ